MQRIISVAALATYAWALTNDKDCAENTICTLEYQPVCGENGITYGNKCQAGCVTIVGEGPCPTEPVSSPVTCANVRCPGGQVCELIDVVCVRAPCPPIAQCVPINDGPINDGPINDGPINDGPINDGEQKCDSNVDCSVNKPVCIGADSDSRSAGVCRRRKCNKENPCSGFEECDPQGYCAVRDGEQKCDSDRDCSKEKPDCFGAIKGVSAGICIPGKCCKAGTAECLSCAAGVTVEEYCEANPETPGCCACGDGFFCRKSCNDIQECVPFKKVGATCGGFTPACLRDVCAPGLKCLDLDETTVDEAGKCSRCSQKAAHLCGAKNGEFDPFGSLNNRYTFNPETCECEAPAKTCYFQGEEYAVGETYRDDCNTCTCQANGVASCTEKLCGLCPYEYTLCSGGAWGDFGCMWKLFKKTGSFFNAKCTETEECKPSECALDSTCKPFLCLGGEKDKVCSKSKSRKIGRCEIVPW